MKLKISPATAILMVGKSTDDVQVFLQAANEQKNRAVFSAIQNHWPQHVTPNHLTLARFGIGLALFFLLFNFRNNSGIIILPLFALGALTDLLDGIIARGFNKMTKFGALADPIADRILLLPVIFYSLIMYNEMLLLLILLSEIINAVISLFALDRGITLEANIFGKAKMALQCVVFVVVLGFWPHSPNIVFVGLLWLSLIFMAISIIFKLVAIKLHYEVAKPQNLQYAFRQEGILKTP